MKMVAAAAGFAVVLVAIARMRDDLRRIEATQDRLISIWAKAVEMNQ